MRTAAMDLRARLLPRELAEAELEAKPAAAVLVLLRERGGALDVLLGKRARREGDPWSGQVAFPGGRHHDADPSLLETALREAREEVGLVLPGRAEVLGHLPPRSPGNVPGMLVVPFVALASEDLRPATSPEMEETFWAPLGELPPARGRATVLTQVGELTVPGYLWRGRVIWGFTYRLLEDLLVLVEAGG